MHAVSTATTIIRAPELVEIVRRCCHDVDLPLADCEAVAEVLLYANLRGQDGHGLVRLPNYMRRVRTGLAGDSSGVRAVAGAGSLRRLDGAKAIGPAAAIKASDMSIELAREHGVAVVALGNATHFGPAGFYARRVAELGLVSIVTSNATRAVAPHGAARALLGTNPLALGIPVGERQIVLDMSTSAIPRGKVRRAAASGVPLPEHVAIDPAGRPTVDAQAALEGSILPIAGAKGSGLALAISMLAIVLADAQADDEIIVSTPPTEGDASQFPLASGSVGQIFIAIDPGPLLGDSSMERAEALVSRLHDLPPAEGFDAPLLPGEAGDAIAADRLAEGIPIGSTVLTQIAETCREFGLDSTATWLEDQYPRG
jgi:LDH2 family malate/lactate/ureidoglycolate dehydrogenase